MKNGTTSSKHKQPLTILLMLSVLEDRDFECGNKIYFILGKEEESSIQ